MFRRLAGLLVLVAAVGAVAWGVGRLPEGTETSSLVIRGAVGLGIGLVVVVFVWRTLRVLTGPAEEPPQGVDARSSEVVYACAVCGTRLRLETASTGKAPRHCGEEMEPQLEARS